MNEETKQVSETNPRFPEATPLSHHDSSYLEMVMEISRSMAQMTERVDALREASKAHDAKLDKVISEVKNIGKEVHGAKVGFKVGLFLITAGIAFLAWLIRYVLTPLLSGLSS